MEHGMTSTLTVEGLTFTYETKTTHGKAALAVYCDLPFRRELVALVLHDDFHCDGQPDMRYVHLLAPEIKYGRKNVAADLIPDSSDVEMAQAAAELWVARVYASRRARGGLFVLADEDDLVRSAPLHRLLGEPVIEAILVAAGMAMEFDPSSAQKARAVDQALLGGLDLWSRSHGDHSLAQSIKRVMTDIDEQGVEAPAVAQIFDIFVQDAVGLKALEAAFR
jgi:hypothetical protein